MALSTAISILIEAIDNDSLNMSMLSINTSREEVESSHRMLTYIDVLVILILAVITFFTIVGNFFVVLAIFIYKPLRTAQNFFIVSLTIADLMVAILVMPFYIAQTVLDCWIFGLTLCKIWQTCILLSCATCILNLCGIALDRYWAIIDPVNYVQKRTFKRVMIMIGLAWGISIVICLPPLFGWNDWSDDFAEGASCQVTSDHGFVIFSTSVSFFIPLFIMTLVYIKIFLTLRRHLRQRALASKIIIVQKLAKRKLQGVTCAPDESNQYDSEISMDDNDRSDDLTIASQCDGDKSETNLDENEMVSMPSENSDKNSKRQTIPKKPIHKTYERALSFTQFIAERQKISLSKERRALRIIVILVGVFVVCWVPYFLMYIIVTFCEKCYISPNASKFLSWLGYINSTINPIVYTIFNADFQRAFSKLLPCK